MSKIPPGEWSAIAARHAKGESLSAIARSYGCTPPAIHYVLKRNVRPAVEKVEQPAEATPPPSDTPRHEIPPRFYDRMAKPSLHHQIRRMNRLAGATTRHLPRLYD